MGKSNFSVATIILAVTLFIVFLIVGFAVGRSGNLLLVILGLAVCVGLILFFISGNRKELALDEAAVADAMRMQAPAGKARLYIVRHGFVGGQQGMDLKIDATHVGQIKSGRALLADFEPGPHILAAQMARGGDGSAAALELDLTAGSVTVVKAGSAMGTTTAKCELAVLHDPSAARAELEKARFLAWEQG